MLTKLIDLLRVRTVVGALTVLCGLIGMFASAVTWVLIGLIVYVVGQTDLFIAFWLTVVPAGFVSAVMTYVLARRHHEAQEDLDE